MLFVRCYFFFYWVLLFVCSAYQQNRNNNHQTNRIASNKSIITHRKRSLQSTLTLISKITASNGESFNLFGNENAISISNNRIVVGAYGYNNNTGAAYFFLDPNDPSSGRSYSQMAILVASDGVFGDWFGRSVYTVGDIIVVGAAELDSNGNGDVYIFRIGDNDNISQVAKITAQNGVTDGGFGGSVAIHGKFILVGAPYVDKNGYFYVGSAYLFVNPSTDPNNPEWTQIMQFQPDDLTEYDEFGRSVAMDDQIAVIGTNDVDANAVYLFVPIDGSIAFLSLWTQMAKLTGPTDSLFGFSVAVAGNTIIVGAPEYVKNNGNNAGAVFVFTKIDGSSSSSSSWTQTNILLAADGAEYDNFGFSVSISKDASTIVVGAVDDDYSLTIKDSGAAYLFRISNSTTTTTNGWTQVGKFVAADRDTEDYLGSSIAIENSIMVVAAPWDDTTSGTDAGSVYILDTGYSSSPPTTAPIQTTTAPTAEPVELTFQPTESPTTKPTNPPATYPLTTMAPDNDNSNNPSLPPATSTPTTKVPTVATSTPPNNSTTSAPSDSLTNTKSDNNNIIITAITVAGAVVVILGLGLGIAFFNYRLRVKREDRLRLIEQQQQQQITPPPLLPPFSGNDRMTEVNAHETPVMADVIFPVQAAEDRTMPAELLLVNPPPTHAPPPPSPPAAAAIGNMDAIDPEKGLPEFKDQTRNATPPVGPYGVQPVGPIKNSQKYPEHPQHQDREEELPGTREVQQQQLRDPPAAINLRQGRLPISKDQVSGE